MFADKSFRCTLPVMGLLVAQEVSNAQDATLVRPPANAPAVEPETRRGPSAEDHAEAQLALAMHYYNGDGLTKDLERAIHWFTKSAEAGNPQAQFNLGSLYSAGQGVKQSRVKAVEWFTKAAAQGHGRALYNLGIAYAKGADGIEVDIPKALDLFERSAFSDDAKGQTGLAWFYGDGVGVEIDPVKAYAWACLAAEKDPQGRAIKNRLKERLSGNEAVAASVLVEDLRKQIAVAAGNGPAIRTGNPHPPQPRK